MMEIIFWISILLLFAILLNLILILMSFFKHKRVVNGTYKSNSFKNSITANKGTKLEFSKNSFEIPRGNINVDKNYNANILNNNLQGFKVKYK